MTNTERIEEHNEKLLECIEIAENLPDAPGGDSFYDVFWDNFQDYGERVSYDGAFQSGYWNQYSFRPKYPIKLVGNANNAFNKLNYKLGDTAYQDLLDISDVSIDVTNATSCVSLFANAKIKGVTLIFSDKVTTLSSAFTKGDNSLMGGMEITLLVPKSTCNWNNAFDYHNVKSLTLLEGTVIGVTGFNVRWATALPKESITSIISALSTTTSSLTVTLSKAAVNKAFETAESANDGSTSAEWLALIGTRSNWTVSLI